MKKKIIGIVLCFLGILLVKNCIVKSKSDTQVPEFVFTYAENQPEDYPTTIGAYKFAELVEEETNGRIKVLVQAEGVLGDEKSVIEQIQFGGIDFARVSVSPLADIIPKLNILQMPYLYTGSEHMWKVLDGKIGNGFLNSFKNFNMVALSWYDAGARNFYNCVRPVNSVEDMKGLKIRVQESKLMSDMVEALEAVPIPLAYEDVYSSLETRAIDGAENNWASYESTSHYEVAKYYTIDEHTRVPEVQICAQATWDKLSKEDQEIIRSCAKKSALYERKLWLEREKKSKKILQDEGVEIIELSPDEKAKFQEAVRGVYEIYCKDHMEVIDEIIEAGK